MVMHVVNKYNNKPNMVKVATIARLQYLNIKGMWIQTICTVTTMILQQDDCIIKFYGCPYHSWSYGLS